MRLIFTSCLVFLCFTGWAQRYSSSASEITFYSDAPIEDIKATNKKAKSVFDAEKGQVAFSIPIDQFEFRKSLMQEHFNEKYLESDKYPPYKCGKSPARTREDFPVPELPITAKNL